MGKRKVETAELLEWIGQARGAGIVVLYKEPICLPSHCVVRANHETANISLRMPQKGDFSTVKDQFDRLAGLDWVAVYVSGAQRRPRHQRCTIQVKAA